MLFEISRNLAKSSVTHILLAEEKTTKKSKYIKHKTKIRENKSSHSGNHANSTNSVRNLPYFSLSCLCLCLYVLYFDFA